MFDDRNANPTHAAQEKFRPLLIAARLIERLERVFHECADESSRTTVLKSLNSARDSFRRCCADYVNVNSHAGSMAAELMDPRQILNDIREACESFAHARGLHCDFAVNPRIPEQLRGHANAFSHTLQVLCSNAIARTATGGICVRVVVDREHDGMIEIRTTVSDTAAGCAEDLELIRPFGPTPIALHECRNEIEANGGTFGIEHEPGRGSTSWFTMRFEIAADSTRESKSINDTHALVVGRDSEETRIISECFECWDIRHTPCADIDELGISLRLSSDHADLLVVGAKDNLELIEVNEGVHAMMNDDPPSLIGISDDQDPASLAAARRAGIAAIINRPLEQAAMFDAVLAAITHCRNVRESTDPKHAPLDETPNACINIDDRCTAHAALFILESLGVPAMITPRVANGTMGAPNCVTISDRFMHMGSSQGCSSREIAQSLVPHMVTRLSAETLASRAA